jgi:Arc/MetJ-type ribon-helix-helix transcriptional regulator
MSANPPKRGQKRKNLVKSKPELSIPTVFSRVRRQIDDRWPNLGRQLVSFIQISREKLDDVYSSAAEVVNEHKEGFEDRRAERKAKTRAEARVNRQAEFKALPLNEKKENGNKPTVTNPGPSTSGKRSTRRPAKNNS